MCWFPPLYLFEQLVEDVRHHLAVGVLSVSLSDQLDEGQDVLLLKPLLLSLIQVLIGVLL